MHIYTIADTVALIALLTLAVLTAVTYAGWHYWWRSAFGWAFLAILLAFVGRTPKQIATIAVPGASDTTFDVLEDLSLIATLLAAGALAYVLYATIRLNIRRAAMSEEERTREYLEHLPGATPEEAKELVACWDELRHSDASVHPAQDTP